MRVILYTGKGGVGKSSIASATAARLAELGRKTLIVSSDLAHNLSDIFEQPVGGAPTQIAENLSALEVDVLREIDENWDSMQEYFSDFLAYLGMDQAVAEEVVLSQRFTMIGGYHQNRALEQAVGFEPGA